MSKTTEKKQSSENQPKRKVVKEPPEKSPETKTKRSASSDNDIENETKKSAKKTEDESDNAMLEKTSSGKASVKTGKIDKIYTSDIRSKSKSTIIKAGSSSDKADINQKKVVKYTNKSEKKKKGTEERENQYTPYKKKVKISFKGFLFSFLIIALFLTLNQFLFHIPGVPTWESVFKDDTPTLSVSAGEVQVHFIDVGQGDSALIITDKKIMLIDSGESEYGNTVTEYIKELGITKLDIIIGSHPHSDHIGSMSHVVENFDVDEFILPRMTKDMIPDTVSYANLIRSIDEKKAKVRFVRGGEKIELSDNCSVDILAPVSDYDDLNNYSVVCRLTHGENSFLFTGDIETSAEYDIVESGADLSADVLKVAHHGSGTSSSYKFLKAVRPAYAVISVGSPNDYGHPNKAVFERYEEFGCKRYRTDINGNIVFISDGLELKVKTENKNGYV